jgi:tetratricopeptide (TPR) repeat protein
VASSIFCFKREFTEAINILVYEPKDITEHYSPEDLALVLQNRESARFIALKRKHSATIHQPIRLLSMARVYVDQENLDDATQALDTTEPLLGANPVIRCSYHRYRALCAAAKGDALQTELHLANARSITQSLPKRDTQWETSIAAGRCYLSLRLTDKASLEFQEARRHTLHPIEKHVTNYWLARTAEAAKRRSEAIRHYQSVVADNIPTWMREESLVAINRLK